MSRRHAKRWLPTPERLANVRGFAPLARFLEARPWLWVAHRRSVARGIGLGVFAGVVPLPLQMALAAVLAVVFRANVAAAIAATWITNPLTFVPILTMAWWIGRLFVRDAAGAAPSFSLPDWSGPQPWWRELWAWLEALGEPVLVGLPATALILGLAAYVVTMVAWRVTVGRAWRARGHAKSPLRDDPPAPPR